MHTLSHHNSLSPQGKLLLTCIHYLTTNLCHIKVNYTARETTLTYISYLTTNLCHIKGNYTARETTLTYISYLTTNLCHIIGELHSKGNYTSRETTQQGKLHSKGNYTSRETTQQGKLHSKGNYSNMYKLAHHNSLHLLCCLVVRYKQCVLVHVLNLFSHILVLI